LDALRRAPLRKDLTKLYPNIRDRRLRHEIHDIARISIVRTVKMKDVEKNIVRCADAAAAKRMMSLIEQVRDKGDSIGGVLSA